MGILRSGILGPMHNKTGSVIGSDHRGQNVVKSLYNKSTKEPTGNQERERLKFGMLSSFLSTISQLIEIGFKQYAKVKTPVNVAFSYNVGHAFVYEAAEAIAEGVWQLNFPALVYSRGDIETPDGAVIVPEFAESGNAMVFSWDAQQQSAYCRYSDLGSFLVYNATKGRAVVLRNACSRSELTYSVPVPADYIGDKLHCYMNFSSADGKKVGNSVYVGEVVLTNTLSFRQKI